MSAALCEKFEKMNVTGFKESRRPIHANPVALETVDIDSWKVDEKVAADGRKYKNIRGPQASNFAINLSPGPSDPLCFIPYGLEITSAFKDIDLDSDASIKLRIAVSEQQQNFIRRVDDYARQQFRNKKQYSSILKIDEDGYATISMKLLLQSTRPTQISYLDRTQDPPAFTRGSGNAFLRQMIGCNSKAKGWACKCKVSFTSLFETGQVCGVNVLCNQILFVRTTTDQGGDVDMDPAFDDESTIIASLA